MSVIGHWKMVIGYGSLGNGKKSLVIGHWKNGHWKWDDETMIHDSILVEGGAKGGTEGEGYGRCFLLV
jgi:hypothetical protein